VSGWVLYSLTTFYFMLDDKFTETFNSVSDQSVEVYASYEKVS